MQRGLMEWFGRSPDGSAQSIYRFSDVRIQSAVDSALASVTKDSAVLHVEKTAEGWNAAVAARINGHWSIAAAYAREEWGDAIGASVKFQW